MLSDRWIQHQRKQNRSKVEHRNQKPIDDEDQDNTRKYSIKACSPELREVPRRSVNSNDFQLVRSKSPASGNYLPTRTITVTDDPKINRSAARSDVPVENDQLGERASKNSAMGEGISSSGSASPHQQVEASTTSPRKVKKAHRLSDMMRYDPLACRRSVSNSKSIWVERETTPTKSAVDHSNIASVAIARKRNQLLHNPTRPATHSLPLKNGSQNMLSSTPTNSDQPNEPTTSNGGKKKFNIILQPEVRPVSQEQLITEVKGIYAGLVMVEAKCIEFDNKQSSLARALTDQSDPNSPPILNHKRLQMLIALHRTLLYEHHDFFRASQHPSAGVPLRRLASKYAMPARLWRHGIHSFLEVLRHLLPASLDHMLAFIYLSYSMIGLLYETVSAFEDIWIECLGDLGRYRMAIEDENLRDREIWTNVARHWYIKASNKAPSTGRLYHHLAILAEPNTVEQLFYYAKSLCTPSPFASARESILTLFEPVLEAKNEPPKCPSLYLHRIFIKIHGIIFMNQNQEQLMSNVEIFTEELQDQLNKLRLTSRNGHLLAITNCIAILGYGSEKNVLMKLITKSDENTDENMEESSTQSSDALASLNLALQVSNSVLSVILDTILVREAMSLSYLHVVLTFLYYMARIPGAMNHIEPGFPWELLAMKLNHLSLVVSHSDSDEDQNTPNRSGGTVPLPEDFDLRGFVWATNDFTDDLFKNHNFEEQEKDRDSLPIVKSVLNRRRYRTVCLGIKISELPSPLVYRDRWFDAKAYKNLT